MINLCLVVIATQFSETKRRETERIHHERNERRKRELRRKSCNQQQSQQHCRDTGNIVPSPSHNGIGGGGSASFINQQSPGRTSQLTVGGASSSTGGCYAEMFSYAEYIIEKGWCRTVELFHRLRSHVTSTRRRPTVGATEMGDRGESIGLTSAALGSRSTVPDTDVTTRQPRYNDVTGGNAPTNLGHDVESSSADRPEVPFHGVDGGRSSSPTGYLNVRLEPQRHARHRRGGDDVDEHGPEVRADRIHATPSTWAGGPSPIVPKASPERVSCRTSINSSTSSSPFHKLSVDHRHRCRSFDGTGRLLVACWPPKSKPLIELIDRGGTTGYRTKIASCDGLVAVRNDHHRRVIGSSFPSCLEGVYIDHCRPRQVELAGGMKWSVDGTGNECRRGLVSPRAEIDIDVPRSIIDDVACDADNDREAERLRQLDTVVRRQPHGSDELGTSIDKYLRKSTFSDCISDTAEGPTNRRASWELIDCTLCKCVILSTQRNPRTSVQTRHFHRFHDRVREPVD